jgi:hypothetical protein
MRLLLDQERALHFPEASPGDPSSIPEENDPDIEETEEQPS